MENEKSGPKGCGKCMRCRQAARDPLLFMKSKHHDFKNVDIPQSSRQRLEHSSYICQTLVEGFTDLLAQKEQKQSDPREQVTIRTEALERWRKWVPTMQATLDSKDLDVDFFFELFDDYFFSGALRSRTTVRMVDRPLYIGAGGKTAVGVALVDPDRKDHVLIKIAKPPTTITTWAEHTVQMLLAILLHEMTHAVFRIFGCRCADCRCLRTEELTRGIKGHGPSWMQLGQAVEKEANRSLREFKHLWFMCVGAGDVSRKEELEYMASEGKKGFGK